MVGAMDNAPKALSEAERRSLAEKAAKLPDNEGMTVELLLGFDDEELRLFADDFSEEESAERERDMDADDWTEANRFMKALPAELDGLSAKYAARDKDSDRRSD